MCFALRPLFVNAWLAYSFVLGQKMIKLSKSVLLIILIFVAFPCWAHEKMWIIIWGSGKYGSEEAGIATHLRKYIFINKAECESFMIQQFVIDGGWVAEKSEFGSHLMVRRKGPPTDISDFTVYTCDNLAKE